MKLPDNFGGGLTVYSGAGHAYRLVNLRNGGPADQVAVLEHDRIVWLSPRIPTAKSIAAPWGFAWGGKTLGAYWYVSETGGAEGWWDTGLPL